MRIKCIHLVKKLIYLLLVGWLGFLPFTIKAASPTNPSMTEKEALFRAVSAYVYGYPLITMDTIRNVMTNTVDAHGDHAPAGQFINLRQFPNPSFASVTAPNADMLYSFAWMDLSKEPYILHVPDTHNRYYIMPLIGAWTNVFSSLGSRTSGTEAQDFVIVGPNWHGKLPTGLTLIQSPTNSVWIKARTYSTGTPEDLEIAHKIQDGYQLKPLSYYNKDYVPPPGHFDPAIDMKTPIREQVNRLDAQAFFNRLALLMKDNPPYPQDKPMIENLARLGIEPGKPFNLNQVDPRIAKALIKSVMLGQKMISERLANAGIDRNGWTYLTLVGNYGTNYLQRALIASLQPGATIPEDLIYPVTIVDSSGDRLDGHYHYVLHFLNGRLPPVNGFWSLTLYDEKYFFVVNPLNRYNITQRDVLKMNRDGSVDIYIQHENPGPNRESNWLPSPKGKFILMFRLYWPRKSVLDGTWYPPRLKKIIRI